MITIEMMEIIDNFSSEDKSFQFSLLARKVFFINNLEMISRGVLLTGGLLVWVLPEEPNQSAISEVQSAKERTRTLIWLLRPSHFEV